MPKENKIEDWEKDILKGCIEAEKLYQFHSDQTPESWIAIYEANVIQKIRQLLKSEKEKLLERIKLEKKIDTRVNSITGRLEYINIDYNQAVADLEKLKEKIKKEL